MYVSADVQLVVRCVVFDAESEQRRGPAGSGRLTAIPDLTSRSSLLGKRKGTVFCLTALG